MFKINEKINSLRFYSAEKFRTADMALAGIKSRITPDDVIDAMKDVGDKMHSSLRETGEGGVAGTHSAKEQISKMQF